MVRRSDKRPKRAWLQVEEFERRVVPAIVAAYSFDQGSGAILTDSSGSGNNGILSNASWSASGKYGSALQFTGARMVKKLSRWLATVSTGRAVC
jgi:hypothetical protein